MYKAKVAKQYLISFLHYCFYLNIYIMYIKCYIFYNSALVRVFRVFQMAKFLYFLSF